MLHACTALERTLPIGEIATFKGCHIGESQEEVPMQIAKDQLIAGQPALRVRSFVRTYRILSFSASEFEKVLNLSPREALNFAHEMVNLGFLTLSTNSSLDGEPVYQVGDQGHMLAITSAAKPISRKTADRVLREFMERVQIVNASNEVCL
jgi:hypothetical protein